MARPARDHPLARSKTAEWADRALAAMWRKGITQKPPLEPEFLWNIGARGFAPTHETALRSEAEALDFRERLDALCTSLRDEAQLNSLGHTMAYGQITSAIRKRHALGALWSKKPDLAQTKLAAPIIVIGQMRSGTTRMQRLLAADPAHSGTRFCNSHDPVPRMPGVRRAKGHAMLAAARRINPWIDALHPIGAVRTDEEIGWLAAALSPCALEVQYRIPSFVRFSEARDPAPIYAEFARILRTDAAAMGNATLPRVLKCPQYSEDLPALLAQFPGARLVVSERDDDAVLASSVSMVAAQMAPQSDCLEMTAIETEWRRKLALRARRTAAALAGFKGPLVRVQFAELDADWRGTMARVYKTLGLRLSRDALAAMEKEQQRSSRDHHRQHQGQMAEFS